MSESCFLAQFVETPCQGRLVRVHLIDKQKLTQRGHDPWDAEAWVWACGGFGYGNEGHHGEFDARKLVVPPALLPSAVIELVTRLRLETWFERRYPA